MVRVRAVDLTRRLKSAGRRRAWVAERLAVPVRTLAQWSHRWEEDRLAAQPRGRPPAPVPPADAAALAALLDFLGPVAALPVLRRSFPELPRAELQERLRAYRHDVLVKNGVEILALRWERAGAVWAMDFAAPPAPVDGVFPCVLSVRDLASGKALLWLPLPDKSAAVVRDALRVLFLRFGPPLVLKSDNESSLKAEEVGALLGAHGVVALHSPCYYPLYNGACEAGIGTLKTYAHHEAARHDRPGEWTCDDVEGARLRANELARPRGHAGPSPAEGWASRTALDPAARGTFYDLLDVERARQLEAARAEKQAELGDGDRTRVERQAITAALVAAGILVVRRRRISPPFKSRLWARIT